MWDISTPPRPIWNVVKFTAPPASHNCLFNIYKQSSNILENEPLIFQAAEIHLTYPDGSVMGTQFFL